MKKIILIAAGIALGLSACSSTHRVEVSLDGKTYRGEWRTSDPSKEQKAATTYPHRKHVGQVQSTLKADDGSTVDCRWLAHGDTAEGACSGNGREYLLDLK